MSEQTAPKGGDFPCGVAIPGESEIVQVLMPQRLVNVFERRCLPVGAKLAGPLLFSEDDVPTYVIQLLDPDEVERQIKAAFPEASKLIYPEDKGEAA